MQAFGIRIMDASFFLLSNAPKTITFKFSEWPGAQNIGDGQEFTSLKTVKQHLDNFYTKKLAGFYRKGDLPELGQKQI
ncbi:hypothetical protein TNCV_1571251 [Trichonephila clavipes]|uniref:Uncharacterized protein n=1 Tax=Trichonephila clavipes TaxID=2585209 RepID=A0A8X6SKA6_TRICX|nr:hypothetical protein TNCV_1571251 [Trichonephila clavipes]